MSPNIDATVNPLAGKGFADLKIAVKNKGHGPGARKDSDPFDPELYYGGKPWIYPVNEITVVPYEVAYFHFAIEVQGGKIVREKKDVNPDGSQSWYANRLASYSPYGLTHGRVDDRDVARFKEFRNWFSDGLEFKIVKTPRVMSTDQFDQLKG